MGRKRTKPSIANRPLSINLAWLLRHPDSEHPMKHSYAGFMQLLENIHLEIKRQNPTATHGLMVPLAIESIINGERKSTRISNIKRIVDAFNSLFSTNIDYQDLYVNQNKWMKIDNLPETVQKSLKKIALIKNENILEAITKIIDAGITEQEITQLPRFPSNVRDINLAKNK